MFSDLFTVETVFKKAKFSGDKNVNLVWTKGQSKEKKIFERQVNQANKHHHRGMPYISKGVFSVTSIYGSADKTDVLT